MHFGNLFPVWENLCVRQPHLYSLCEYSLCETTREICVLPAQLSACRRNIHMRCLNFRLGFRTIIICGGENILPSKQPHLGFRAHRQLYSRCEKTLVCVTSVSSVGAIYYPSAPLARLVAGYVWGHARLVLSNLHISHIYWWLLSTLLGFLIALVLPFERGNSQIRLILCLRRGSRSDALGYDHLVRKNLQKNAMAFPDCASQILKMLAKWLKRVQMCSKIVLKRW
jgi:hypothetical protein